ncbi:hypothetical protein WKG92_19755 [Pantoea agglomerans]|uniref:hypothetical protein n=1 Tax=Enterobacter agglomerans TaxID=549 RepID=UPI003C7CA7B1
MAKKNLLQQTERYRELRARQKAAHISVSVLRQQWEADQAELLELVPVLLAAGYRVELDGDAP